MSDADTRSDTLEQMVERAFAPLHKAALGMACGTTAAVGLFAVTALQIVAKPPIGEYLVLLSQYFYGYQVTWRGAAIGSLWCFFVGFVAGWFGAFVRNLVLATWIFLVRARADMSRTADFLDHI